MSLHHKYRVLLVDDCVPARITLRSVLNEGRQAIEQVAACQPDVVLMDYSMPYMNGIEAARLIKKFWEETVIIGLCTVPETYITDGFLNAGALAVVHKDRMEHLHSTIQQAFPKRASSDFLMAT